MAEFRGDLARLLDEYDARRNAAAAREQSARDDDARFLTQFAEIRRDVVRPVFEAAGVVLAERGHAFSITEDEFSGGGSSKVTEAAISLHIVPAGRQAPLHDDHARSLSITTRHYNKTVWINAGHAPEAGGIAGAKGAYPLARIDRELVQEELLRFVAGIVAA